MTRREVAKSTYVDFIRLGVKYSLLLLRRLLHFTQCENTVLCVCLRLFYFAFQGKPGLPFSVYLSLFTPLDPRMARLPGNSSIAFRVGRFD